jgi:Ca-activated chloride channel family protein
MDVRFQQLWALHLLWVVLGLAVVIVLSVALRRRRITRFAEQIAWARLVPTLSPGRRGVRIVLLVAAFVSLVAALVDPRWGVRFEEVQPRGADVMVVLDASRSMLAADATPNRLERAKQFAGDLAAVLAGDRIGLITFAGSTSVQCPLTNDYGAFRLALDEVTTDTEARGGSLLGDALRRAGESFVGQADDARVVVVLSDFEDHGSFPVDAAAQLGELGIRVSTIGIGDEERGALIPVIRGGQQLFLEHEGQQVWSRMDRAAMEQIARAGDGVAVRAGVSQADIGRIYAEQIEPFERGAGETARLRRYTPRYQWFAGAALVLLFVESLVVDRRGGGDAR